MEIAGDNDQNDFGTFGWWCAITCEECGNEIKVEAEGEKTDVVKVEGSRDDFSKPWVFVAECPECGAHYEYHPTRFRGITPLLDCSKYNINGDELDDSD